MKIYGLSLALALTLSASAAQAQQCSGNACDVISLEKQGDCVVIRNLSSRPVLVKPRTTFVSFGTVYANSTFSPLRGLQGEQGCVTDYSYDYSAIYSGGGANAAEGCTAVRPLAELGYGTGSKYKLCVRKGYYSVTNFPGAGYRDYGGGFCYTGNAQACLEQMRGYPK